MNRVETVGWARPGAAEVAARTRGPLPVELSILATAIAGELLGAITHPLLGAGVAIAIATVVTMRHIGSEVRALQAWEAE